MLDEKLSIGMDYNTACEVLKGSIICKKESGNLKWFSAKPEELFCRMHTVIQVTAKDGYVIEILAVPDWEKYKEKGDFNNHEKSCQIWDESTSYIEYLYGSPIKEKEGKKVWKKGRVEIKAKLENGRGSDPDLMFLFS